MKTKPQYLLACFYTGKCNVHLTGYLDPEFEEVPSDDEEEEEDEEAPTLVPAKGKRKLENSNDASSSKKKVRSTTLQSAYKWFEDQTNN